MGRNTAAALASLLLTAVPLSAAIAADTSHGAISLLVENDLFFNTDRHYTNGIGLAYTTPSLVGTHDWAVDAADALPFFQDDGLNFEVRATYELGQDMFTPEATALIVPDPKDRPYAGYLFAAVGVLSKSDDHMDQLQLQLGMIGPASLAEDAQKFVHSIIYVPKPKGWPLQLCDEPGLELTFDRAWRYDLLSMRGLDFDVMPHAGAAIGNVYDYANAGLMVRGGYALPRDFGPMRLDPSLPGSNFFEPTNPFSAYVFAGIDARAVAHNIFLDGNTFQASRSVDRNILVGDLLIGAAIETDWARVSFTHVFRTKEFRTQTSTDQFGAVTISVAL